jgi:hypothetical protein
MFKDLNKQLSGRDLSDYRTKNKSVAGMTDAFLAGAQDNGTQFLSDSKTKSQLVLMFLEVMEQHLCSHKT